MVGELFLGKMRGLGVTTGNPIRRSIAILMPMVWGIRNVVHSGVLERLAKAGVDVHLLMRDYDPSLSQRTEYADFSLAASCWSLVRSPIRRQIKGRSFLRDVIHSAFARLGHEDLLDMPMIITEMGIPWEAPGWEKWRADDGRAYREGLQDFDQEILQDDYVLGACLYQVGQVSPQHWESEYWNVHDLLPWLAEYLGTG